MRLQLTSKRPWTLGNGDLPTNYEINLKRLQTQLRKLRNDPPTFIEYGKIIKDKKIWV